MEQPQEQQPTLEQFLLLQREKMDVVMDVYRNMEDQLKQTIKKVNEQDAKIKELETKKEEKK